MRLSMLILAGALATGQAFGQEAMTAPVPTAQEKKEQRETLRRAAVTEHEKRKQDFARNCIRPGLTEAQLDACRAAYRRL